MEPIQRISEANTNHKRNVSLLRVCFTNDLLYIEVKSPPRFPCSRLIGEYDWL